MVPIIHEHARVTVPSPAKLNFIMKETINLKHKTHSFIFLTGAGRYGMTTRAAGMTGEGTEGVGMGPGGE